MKLIYITITISFLLIALTIKAQKAFLKAQTSGWYPLFLKPVVDRILADKNNIKILDIGTGPGKLLELLNEQNADLQLTGIDIDTSMINEARKKISHKNVLFHYQRVNEKLEFTDNEFDAVTFCSVLFLLDDTTKAFLFNEALRVLKPDGKIIVLTPSGKKMIISSFVEVWKYPYSSTNWTFIVWKTLTTKGARKWNRSEWLKRFSKQKNLKYTGEITFTKNATIEIITK